VSTEPAPSRTPADPDGLRLVDWFTRPTADRPGRLNLAYNALDRHVVRGLAEQAALLYPQATGPTRSFYSYADLLERVGQLAGGLQVLRVAVGQPVLVLLPLVPELVIALLACARVGAVAVPVDVDAFDADPGVAVRDLLVETPAVALVDGPRKVALDEVLAGSGRTAGSTVTLRPEPGSQTRPSDVDFALLMKPGSYEPGVCAELGVSAPLLVLPAGSGSVVRDHGWAVDLVADARERGLAPGSYVSPDDYRDPDGSAAADARAAALLGPLLVGATVELR
jgi:propionyl-CoA synthetase